ncbi:hypothetical protein D920_01696 [Enterococcus faecalis 13-SD-W-01]|nr:hypothetical protein D920_01696 [Enterococcus faecalis 13-SD-W-01]
MIFLKESGYLISNKTNLSDVQNTDFSILKKYLLFLIKKDWDLSMNDKFQSV